DRPQMLAAFGMLQRQEGAGQRIHQRIPSRPVRLFALNLRSDRVLGDFREQRIKVRAFVGTGGHRETHSFTRSPRGPTYFTRGRYKRLLACCSMTCAPMPAVRAARKIGV